MEWIKKQLGELAGTRWLVVLGVAALIAVFVTALFWELSPVAAFFLALGAYATVVGLAGVSRRIWKGEEVKSAPVPGGGALDVEAVETVQQGLTDLNKRVDAHIETVNKRLYDLDRAVFKRFDGENDGKE